MAITARVRYLRNRRANTLRPVRNRRANTLRPVPLLVVLRNVEIHFLYPVTSIDTLLLFPSNYLLLVNLY